MEKEFPITRQQRRELSDTLLKSHGISIPIKHNVHSWGWHTSAVYSVAISPDGKYILTGGLDNTAILWDISTGKRIKTFAGHTGGVNSVAFSPDGRFILTGSYDNNAILWEVISGRQIRTFAGHAYEVTSVAFSPDGKFILTGSDDHTAILWDVINGRRIRTFAGHTKGISSVAFSPDGRFILTGSKDNTSILWDVISGRQIRTFEGHTQWVESVAFSPDGKFILTGSWDKTAHFRNRDTGELLAALYNLKEGFLWTTPPDEMAKSGWFWTDRPDLINVVKCHEDGSDAEVLADDSEERLEYIKLYNQQDMVMNRLNNWEKYKSDIELILRKNKHKRIENHLRHTQLLIE